jgi:hypothetical protein
VYSSPEHETRRLAQHDLREGGRPDIRVLPLSETISAMNKAGFFGLNILNTQYANMRVFLQIWDRADGSIAWEGIDELTFAMDTGQEKPIAFRAVAERAAQDLVKRLP